MRGYIKEKIKILKEIGISLSTEQKEHLYSLSNEIQVDNYSRKLIMDSFEKQNKKAIA